MRLGIIHMKLHLEPRYWVALTIVLLSASGVVVYGCMTSWGRVLEFGPHFLLSLALLSLLLFLEGLIGHGQTEAGMARAAKAAADQTTIQIHDSCPAERSGAAVASGFDKLNQFSGQVLAQLAVAESKQAELEKGFQSLRESVESVTSILIKGAIESGIAGVFSCRDEAVPVIVDRIKKAKVRVLIHAVCLARGLEASKVAHLVVNVLSRQKKLDVRFLLLDAIRGPAAFRMLFEGSANAWRRAVGSGNDGLWNYLEQHPLYARHEQLVAEMWAKEELHGRVRFYSQAPANWFVVVDDDVFYQHYNFGGFTAGPNKDLMMSDRAPVLQVHIPREQVGKKGLAVSDFISHFDNMWRTSNLDLFGAFVRKQDKTALFKEVVEKHGAALRRTANALGQRAEKRNHVRRGCETDSEVVVIHGATKWNMTIVDYSYGGVRLRLSREVDGSDEFARMGTSECEVDVSRQQQNCPEHSTQIERFDSILFPRGGAKYRTRKREPREDPRSLGLVRVLESEEAEAAWTPS